MAERIRTNNRIEEYRKHIKSSLEELLGDVDNLLDYCYTDRVQGINIHIQVNADSTIPKIQYEIDKIVIPTEQREK